MFCMQLPNNYLHGSNKMVKGRWLFPQKSFITVAFKWNLIFLPEKILYKSMITNKANLVSASIFSIYFAWNNWFFISDWFSANIVSETTISCEIFPENVIGDHAITLPNAARIWKKRHYLLCDILLFWLNELQKNTEIKNYIWWEI